MTDLVTLNTAKRALRLGRTDTTLDDELGRVISSATSLIEEHFGVGVQRSFTELHDGQTDTVWLRRRPIVSLTSVSVDGVELSDLSDYVLPDDGFGALYGHWHRPIKPKGLQVTYVAGHFADIDAVSAHWTEGALLQIRHQWKPYQENTGSVNEFDTAAVAAASAGMARGLKEHFVGDRLPGIA